MRFEKPLAWLTSALALAASIYLWLDQRWIGFPDGAATELERAQRPLFQLYSVANLALALGMGVVGVKWLPDSRFWSWCFWSGILIFVMSWLGFAWINYWWGSFMLHGGGG